MKKMATTLTLLLLAVAVACDRDDKPVETASVEEEVKAPTEAKETPTTVKEEPVPQETTSTTIKKVEVETPMEAPPKPDPPPTTMVEEDPIEEEVPEEPIVEVEMKTPTESPPKPDPPTTTVKEEPVEEETPEEPVVEVEVEPTPTITIDTGGSVEEEEVKPAPTTTTSTTTTTTSPPQDASSSTVTPEWSLDDVFYIADDSYLESHVYHHLYDLFDMQDKDIYILDLDVLKDTPGLKFASRRRRDDGSERKQPSEGFFASWSDGSPNDSPRNRGKVGVGRSLDNPDWLHSCHGLFVITDVNDESISFGDAWYFNDYDTLPEFDFLIKFEGEIWGNGRNYIESSSYSEDSHKGPIQSHCYGWKGDGKNPNFAEDGLGRIAWDRY